MRYECGAEAAAATAKIANIENMNVGFQSCRAVAERYAAALRNFFPRTMERFVPLLQDLPSGKWAWSAFQLWCCCCFDYV